ncbi:MAG TPA: ABC transporter permease [Candidatus Dormibacteraeota bacterium]|nr:ABC transporter permease [Candidatus Dormibacteraeota bacterium]
MKRMPLGENMKMALDTLRQNKVRSFLTVLGVVIGITALITVASILVGFYADVTAYLNDYGPNTIWVFKVTPGASTGRMTPEERNRKPLTLEDAEAIRAQCPAILEVSATVFQRVYDVNRPPLITARYKDKEVSGLDYMGADINYEDVFNIHPYVGRFFTEAENLHRADVAVIGFDLGKAFFPGEDPINKIIYVEGFPYRVIGVFTHRKGQLFQNPAAEKQVVVPYRTYRKHHPADDEHFIGAVAAPNRMAEAQDEIRGVLRRRRHVAYSAPDNFGMSTAKEIADQFKQITGSVALLTAVVSSIGLLVGGVGVMNIMLMSVTQRTREIGVRKAIGARRRDVIWQFLTEAVVLTGAGGVIGVALGIAISLLINVFLPRLPSSVPLWAVALGVLVSMSVGLFFGIYPAVKAARLDPVDALRYE